METSLCVSVSQGGGVFGRVKSIPVWMASLVQAFYRKRVKKNKGQKRKIWWAQRLGLLIVAGGIGLVLLCGSSLHQHPVVFSDMCLQIAAGGIGLVLLLDVGCEQAAGFL